MTHSSNLTQHLDKFAISASTICAIHCLTLPIMLAVFPAMGTTFFGQESFHVLLLWLVIPLSLVSLSLGCKQHKSLFVAFFGFTGLSILILTAVLGHDVLGETGERIMTLIGATSIAIGHLRNYVLCRKKDCNHED